jgi:membrane protease YdiL (CAAX protease family)
MKLTNQNIKRKATNDLYTIGFIGLLIFVPLFVFRNLGILDFWWWMSLNLTVVISLSLWRDRKFRQELLLDWSSRRQAKIFWGVASAAVLYLVFFVGNILVREVFDFAPQDIRSVYGFKGDASAWRIALLMLLFIGPGEELFWRGFIQGNLAALMGRTNGFLLAVLFYTIIHVATGNLILIVAALTGGLFWGWLYRQYQSMLLNMVSHIVWDISVFLLFPFGS